MADEMYNQKIKTDAALPLASAVEPQAGIRKKGKLVWFFTAALGMLIVTLNVLQIIVMSYNTKKSVEKSYIADCRQIADTHSQAISNKLDSYMKQMYQYTKADIVQTESTVQIVSWLTAHSGIRSSDFDYILYCGEDGKAYTDIGATADISSRPYFKAVMQQGKDEYIDDPVISQTTGKPVIHITQAVKAGGKTIGFFAGVVNLSDIQESIADVKIGNAGYAWMLASDGTVIAHPDSDLLMNKNFITGNASDHKDIAELAGKMCGGETGTAWIAGLQGGKELAVYTPVNNTPWSLAVSIPESQVYDTADKLLKTMSVASFIIVLLIILAGGCIIFISLRPLATVEKTIMGIASGHADLTKRIEVKSKNEIGSVVGGFNQFIGKLHTIISELKKSKEILTTAGEDLHASTQDTAAVITQILSNIASMSNHITNQASGVDETAGAVNEIASNIQSLEHMIETQAAGVTQASAAVEEMIGNINAVNSSVEKMVTSFSILEKNALDGASKQQDVNERIEQIEAESEMLQEANTAIANIASQTNLLAMNAAIEAAHAGEAGKGFSVVADEIRKLSETSTSESKTIGDQLNKIKDSINSVVTASAQSSTAFTTVADGIRNTDELVRQIKAAMEEQKEGSKQINTALHSMNDSTSEVRTASSEMAAGNQAILEEVKNLQEATFSMKNSMMEMSAGAKKISETGTALAEIVNKMKDSINSIGEQIDLFKV